MTPLLLFVLLSADAVDSATERPELLRGLSAGEAIAAQQIAETVSASEFLGPLAPVALSPFFGVACLSGLAQFGPESLGGGNAMLASNSPLAHPAVFWIFGVLAIVTSIPRLTKVSKPIAGAFDQVEAWSGIITMIVVKFLIPSVSTEEVAAVPTVHVAGIGALSLDVLLAIAAGVNIFVVNSVKFFFEFLIWITPVPFLDACFEVANKTLCAGLIAVYAFSPALSLGLNLLLFGTSAIAFFWIKRQVTFYRSMLFGWLLGLFRDAPPRVLAGDPIVVFPKNAIGPFAARQRLLLHRRDDRWVLESQSFLRPNRSVVVTPPSPSESGRLDPGWIAHTISLSGDAEGEAVGPLLLSRRYHRSLAQLADVFRLDLAQEAARDRQRLRAELG